VPSPFRPFPTSGILPEARQIGRVGAIDKLEKQVVAGRHHTWLVSERRTGKSSVAQAVLDRTRARATGAGWALRVDFKNGAIASSTALAEALAMQARAAGLKVTPTRARWLSGGRIAAGAVQRVAPIAQRLGVEIADDAQMVARAVESALGAGPGTTPDLQQVVAALQAAAIAEERVVVLFVDEVQELTSWDDDRDALVVERQLAALMDHADGDVVLMLAGSDGRAIDDLRVYGRPLHYEGISFALPEIAQEDWVAGLRERFREIEVEMPRGLILDILEESGGHPLRTMTVCAQLEQLVEAGETVLPAFNIEAIALAKRQPSWDL
jgi:hypothetical protein